MTVLGKLGALSVVAVVAIAALTLDAGRSPQVTRQLEDVPWLEPCGVDRDQLCGRYAVPEDRADGGGRQLELAVTVIPARGPDRRPDPLVYLAGGPGASARAIAAVAAFPPFGAINRTRDLVLVDRRGTGGSQPLECDLYGSTAAGQLRDFLPIDGVVRCRRELERFADLTLYTSPIAMDDLVEVLEALGYGEVNLYGTSYGTREASLLARRHPDRVRSAILIGAADPDLRMPLPYPTDTEWALEAVLDACLAEPACSEAYPRIRQELAAVAARLAIEPARVELDGESLVYRRETFAEMVRYLLYSTATANRLPAMIHAGHQGDLRPLVAWSVQRRRLLAGSMGLFLSVTCPQDVARIDPAEVASRASGTLLGDYRFRQQRAACDRWPVADLPPDFQAPWRSQRPVLLLSGAYDPVTPPARADAVARHLEDALHLIVPGAAHGWGGVNGVACLQQIVVDFLDGGTGAVDTACLPEVTRRPFTVH